MHDTSLVIYLGLRPFSLLFFFRFITVVIVIVVGLRRIPRDFCRRRRPLIGPVLHFNEHFHWPRRAYRTIAGVPAPPPQKKKKWTRNKFLYSFQNFISFEFVNFYRRRRSCPFKTIIDFFFQNHRRHVLQYLITANLALRYYLQNATEKSSQFRQLVSNQCRYFAN